MVADLLFDMLPLCLRYGFPVYGRRTDRAAVRLVAAVAGPVAVGCDRGATREVGPQAVHSRLLWLIVSHTPHCQVVLIAGGPQVCREARRVSGHGVEPRRFGPWVAQKPAA